MRDKLREFICTGCNNPCIIHVLESDGIPSKCIYGIENTDGCNGCRWDEVGYVNDILPKYETVEQWESRTGDTYPGDGPVWARYDKKWHLYEYNGYARGASNLIVATHHGKPT